MIFIKSRSYEEITKQLNQNDVVTLIGCQSCARSSGVSETDKMRELALRLRADGYKVKDGYAISDICTPKVLYAKLGKDVSAVIVLSCSAGVANVKRYFQGVKIVETSEDIGLALADTDKKVMKVTLPYESNINERGKEYRLLTGDRLNSDDNLFATEVEK